MIKASMTNKEEFLASNGKINPLVDLNIEGDTVQLINEAISVLTSVAMIAEENEELRAALIKKIAISAIDEACNPENITTVDKFALERMLKKLSGGRDDTLGTN